ncbi:hypothetical protein FQA39_LY16694 [Lamprigera yunnana]|nr:hypothetical protein FQA39_LY16694 [Lamprigera yunnana]
MGMQCKNFNKLGSTIGFLFLIFALAEASSSPQQNAYRENFNNATKRCAEKYNLKFDDRTEYFQVLHAKENETVLLCKCVYEEMGFLNNDGQILYEKVKTIPHPDISAENYSALVDTCKNATSNNISKIPYTFSTCLSSNINQLIQTQQTQNQENAMKLCSEKTNHAIRNYRDFRNGLNTHRTKLFYKCYLQELQCLNNNEEILFKNVKKLIYPGISSSKLSNFVDLCKMKGRRGTPEGCYTFLGCVQSHITYEYHRQRHHKYYEQEKTLKTCAEKANITVQRYYEIARKLPTHERNVQLISECYLKELGYLSDNGQIRYQAVQYMVYHGIPDEYVSFFVDRCKSIRGNNTAETCYKFLYCVQLHVNHVYRQYHEYNLKKQHHKQEDAMKLCSKKTNGTIWNYDDFTKALSVGGQQISLFSKCYLLELRCLNNEKIMYEQVKKAHYPGIHLEKYYTIVDRCQNKNGSNIAETSYILLNCIQKQVNHINRKEIERKQVHQERNYHYARMNLQEYFMRLCSQKTKLHINNYKDYATAIYRHGERVQLFSECYLRKLRYLNSNGDILYEDVKKMYYPDVVPDKLSSFVNLCRNGTENGTSETSHKFLSCVQTKVNAIHDQQKKLVNLIKQQRCMQQDAVRMCSNDTNRTYEDYIAALPIGGQSILSLSKCFLEKLGYLNDNGEILYDRIKEMHYPGISINKSSSFVDLCRNETGTTTSETAYKFLSCMQTNVDLQILKQLSDVRRGQIRRQKTLKPLQTQFVKNVTNIGLQDKRKSNNISVARANNATN